MQREALVEAQPAGARWALEPLLHVPVARLREQLPELLGFVDALDAEGRLAHISERIRFHLAQQGEPEHAEAVYNLDAMRAAIHAFRARIEELSRRDEDDHELLEMERFGVITIAGWDSIDQRIRLFRRDQMPSRERHVLRAEILETLAEGYWLRRALRLADDPTQHAVFVDVSRAADLADPARFAAADPGLIHALVQIYAEARGEVESWAASNVDDGRTVNQTAAGLGVVPAADRYVLRVVGLCVRDLFGLEDGAHVWTSLARGPEVVRVRVFPALPGETPVDVIQRPVAGSMPPVVRKLRFDPPRAGGAPAPFEIEDYVMGYAETVSATSLADALVPLWLLRSSREEDA